MVDVISPSLHLPSPYLPTPAPLLPLSYSFKISFPSPSHFLLSTENSPQFLHNLLYCRVNNINPPPPVPNRPHPSFLTGLVIISKNERVYRKIQNRFRYRTKNSESFVNEPIQNWPTKCKSKFSLFMLFKGLKRGEVNIGKGMGGWIQEGGREEVNIGNYECGEGNYKRGKVNVERLG